MGSGVVAISGKGERVKGEGVGHSLKGTGWYWLGVLGVVPFGVGLSPGPPLCHGNEPWRGRGRRGPAVLTFSLFKSVAQHLLNVQVKTYIYDFVNHHGI